MGHHNKSRFTNLTVNREVRHKLSRIKPRIQIESKTTNLGFGQIIEMLVDAYMNNVIVICKLGKLTLVDSGVKTDGKVNMDSGFKGKLTLDSGVKADRLSMEQPVKGLGKLSICVKDEKPQYVIETTARKLKAVIWPVVK